VWLEAKKATDGWSAVRSQHNDGTASRRRKDFSFRTTRSQLARRRHASQVRALKLESSASSPSATPSSPAINPSSSTPTTPCVILLPTFRFWGIVHKQGVERQCVGQHEVPDIVAADRERIESQWVTIACCHFYGLEMGIHLHVDAFDKKRVITRMRQQFTDTDTPVMVPCTTDPFFSSMVTVSLFNFIKNLK
jgi:hypothetical protein